MQPLPLDDAIILTCASHPGANREIKKAVEAYWAGKISADDLTKAAADVRKTSWTSLKERGVTLVPRCVSCAKLYRWNVPLTS